MARPPARFILQPKKAFGQDAKSAVVPKGPSVTFLVLRQENSEAHDGSTLLLLCKSVSNVSRELLVFSEVCIRFRGAHAQWQWRAGVTRHWRPPRCCSRASIQPPHPRGAHLRHTHSPPAIYRRSHVATSHLAHLCWAARTGSRQSLHRCPPSPHRTLMEGHRMHEPMVS